ncbi:MAG: hypothetical protein OEY30_00170 [Candidatus Bathyarchaeota archaeon]|nr:hypothetical protein [Candidatus Bathyarchaeota archaeon]
MNDSKADKYRIARAVIALVAVGILISAAIMWRNSTIIFQDDFSADLSNWQVVNGVWALEMQTLRCDSTARMVVLYNGDVGSNYEITCHALILGSASKPEAQIAFRYGSDGNYYFAGLGAYGYKAAIGIFESGAASMLSSGGNGNYSDINGNVWYTLKVRVKGSSFSVYVNGEFVCSTDDTTHEVGRVGLTAIYSTVYYDDFQVRRI